MIRYLLLDILIAFILDLMIGDPKWLPHPIRVIGGFIKKVERVLLDRICKKLYVPVRAVSKTITVRAYKAERYERIAGFVLLFTAVLSVVTVIYGILYYAQMLGPKFGGYSVAFHILNIYIIFTSLATKSLASEVAKIYDALDARKLFDARKYLSYVVSRDTDALSEPEIVKGAVETTAENTIDGIVSPLFYAVLGSIFGIAAPLVYMFKTISTLDSMVGYMNNRYKFFGFASAKADDILNYIPARLGGILILAASYVAKFDYKSSYKILLRDRKKHKSPNAGYPESAFAGALNVTLGGPGIYFGETVQKPYIGDVGKDLVKGDIKDAIKLMYVTVFLGISLFLGVAAASAWLFTSKF